jgi:hypothetical protein
MPDQHVTQMDGHKVVPADLPQTVWQMTAPAAPTHEVSEPTEQSAPVAAAEQE